VAVWQWEDSHEATPMEARAEGAARARGAEGPTLGELCAEHEICQGQSYQWRDQFLAHTAKAFEPAGAPQRQGRLERENARLKSRVGELTLELKKSEEILG
jgi:transposase-like protein